VKDLISINDLSTPEIKGIFQLTKDLKQRRERGEKVISLLAGKNVGLLFEKPSTRTRISFEVGINELGGNSFFFSPEQLQLGRGESIADTGRILSLYLDGVVVRAYRHQMVEDLAKYCTIPVINALTDLLHPCQILADIYTLKEKKGKLEGLKVAFIGAGNNVSHSWIYGAAKVGINLLVATPRGYEPNKEIVQECKIELTNDPRKAAKGADVLYTDVWTSMGEEEEEKQRKKDFQHFQVNSELLKLAKKDVLVMHCLPAHRGEEIASEVIDGPHSIVWEQAGNRLHVQKAILLTLLPAFAEPTSPK